MSAIFSRFLAIFWGKLAWCVAQFQAKTFSQIIKAIPLDYMGIISLLLINSRGPGYWSKGYQHFAVDQITAMLDN